MNEEVWYADVVLPLAVPNLYTYSIPSLLQSHIKPGQRVVVQFGKKRLYTALVVTIHKKKPELYKAKQIESILDHEPIVNSKQFALWKWISNYYLCSMGSVMNAALPSGLKLSSETKLVLNTDCTIDNHELSDDEYLIHEALQKSGVITLSEAENIVQTTSAMHVIKSLLEKGYITIQEELKQKFKHRTEQFVRLTTTYDKEDTLKEVFENLEKKSFKQLEVLMEYIRLSELYSSVKKEVKKSDLLKKTGASSVVFNELEKKNILEVYKKETGRFANTDASSISKTLSQEQEDALAGIQREWIEKEVVLLHGVTGSGKTEVYVKLIEEILKQGKQVLYLLPEIALTTQVVMRIKKYFGSILGVYHSKFNENERVEVWNEVLKYQNAVSKFQIILGARSALFLPYSNLGLVIVDEEHDMSYKQFDPAPRYHARDTAILLASLHQAKVVLGSATPSIESFYNVERQKYGYVQLNTRFGGVQLPEIIVADIKDATKRKKMKSHFSPILLEYIEQALTAKEQIIIFQNRRGFAPYLECKTCGWVPVCKNCDVSMVYHKTGNHLRCHYCGYINSTPATCAACGSNEIQTKNFGTEKIEEELQIFFPDAHIARMDYDSTRVRYSHERLIHDFESRAIDILVGTQMVTKGLDFENVSLVGILSADQMLHFPDFRSHEKSFQMLAQVSGRAGRKNKRGKVILQTYSPQYPIIQHVINNEFGKMYKEEIIHRKNFQYPPFYRLIALTVMDKNIDLVNSFSTILADTLKQKLGKRILGPEFPIIPRIKNLYHKKIIVKIPKEESGQKIKGIIHDTIIDLQTSSAYKYLRIQTDVDPI